LDEQKEEKIQYTDDSTVVECPQPPEEEQRVSAVPEVLPVRRVVCVILEVITLVAAAYFIAAFVYISFSRVAFPFEIEWMEGGMVDHGARIMQVEGLYVEPSVDFIPYLYPPLYSIVLALGYWIFGICLWWGRLVSIIATLVACAVAFRWVQVETGRWRFAALSVGLFLASFSACGAWFDINRVDMLLLALLAGGMYLLRGELTQRRVIGSAILLAAAFFTKQFAVIFLVAGAMVALLKSRRQGIVFCAVGFGIAAVFTALITAISGGWYWYYCFTVPSQHGMDWSRVEKLWRGDIIHRFPFQIAGCLAGAVAWIFTAERFRLGRFPVIIVAALCGVAASFLGRIHFGGYDNTLIPMAFFTAVFLMVAAGKLTGAERGTMRACAVAAVVCAVALFQFYIHDYAIMEQVPTKEDYAAGQRFVEKVRKSEGDVFIPFHSYYWLVTGKKMRFHVIALHDIITLREIDENGNARMVMKHEEIPKDITAAFEDEIFDAVIPDVNPDDRRGYYFGTIAPLLTKYYRPARTFPALPSPVTGMGTVTGRLWLPRSAVRRRR
jgi:hypothetical protein